MGGDYILHECIVFEKPNQDHNYRDYDTQWCIGPTGLPQLTVTTNPPEISIRNTALKPLPPLPTSDASLEHHNPLPPISSCDLSSIDFFLHLPLLAP